MLSTFIQSQNCSARFLINRTNSVHASILINRVAEGSERRHRPDEDCPHCRAQEEKDASFRKKSNVFHPTSTLSSLQPATGVKELPPLWNSGAPVITTPGTMERGRVEAILLWKKDGTRFPRSEKSHNLELRHLLRPNQDAKSRFTRLGGLAGQNCSQVRLAHKSHNFATAQTKTAQRLHCRDEQK
jgi:hypothetical protein